MLSSDLGVSQSDYIVIVTGGIVVLLTDIAGRKMDVRDRIMQKKEIFWYPGLAIMFIIILIFGVYGMGYDSSQFIYNRF